MKLKVDYSLMRTMMKMAMVLEKTKMKRMTVKRGLMLMMMKRTKAVTTTFD